MTKLEIKWDTIKPYQNSKNNAFEELVCQVARDEEIANGKTFDRIVAPDGGIEAYWTLKNGNKYGWQAKFFFSLKTPQWKQIEKSFLTALSNHKKLVKYYVCLPMDKNKTLAEKWESKKKKWINIAKKRKRKVEIIWWGHSELLHRLSQDKHIGRRYFWFSQEEFTDNWFSERLTRAIDDLGNRYTPLLNFELEIAKVFHGLARGEGCSNEFRRVFEDILKSFNKASDCFQDDSLSDERKNISDIFGKFTRQFESIDYANMETINYISILKGVEAIQESISKGEQKLDSKLEECREKEDKTNPGRGKCFELESKIERLEKFSFNLYHFSEFLKSPLAKLANLPVMILRGEAGMGKSHLIADIAKKRMEDGKTSILLLGQHFTNDNNPWSQILNDRLRLNISESEFLDALNAKGQSIGSRIIIFIDAINEGRGKHFWRENIRSFIRSFEKYKWVGLVLSIRTSYEPLLVPKEMLTQTDAVRITHHGFEGVEYEASKLFFNTYGIEQPAIPLLHPEFQNPLFLKLFCEGLQKAGRTTIPEGYEGVTTIISFFLDKVNENISAPNRLDYHRGINLVDKAVKLIAKERFNNDDHYISVEKANEILEQELRKHSNKSGLLDELISEGVFSKNLFWKQNDQYEEGIYFAYERFEDNIVTSDLLDRYLDPLNPETSFSVGQKLYELSKDEQFCYFNKGIIEALSIQLPERVGKEFYELAPHCKKYFSVIESFVKSLIWRKTETLSTKILDYVNKYVIKDQRTNDEFLETLLLVTSNPKHFFNADFLHKHLMRFSLGDRDAWWTPYINPKYDQRSGVSRLIDWAWSEEGKSYVSDESLLLISKTISWFLTSSNRFLRDAATKALVALLENKIDVLIKLLRKFEGVNDPYVYERLFAVAYGCVLRDEEKSHLKGLGKYIFETIFNQEYVYPHILLRDYAREIIEYSLHLGIRFSFDINKIRPPYRSEWPKRLPTNKAIDKFEYKYNSKGFKDYYWSQNEIIGSMVTEYGRRGALYGDFGRYVFQSALRHWKNLEPQRIANLAVKRIFELGYDVEKHGKYDRTNYHNVGRGTRKQERIGKKYQWIAFHETLAKVSDNFTMYDESSWTNEKPLKYDGPWEPYVRDIDPTMLIKNTGKERYE